MRYLPEERYLVHGDYGHNNLVVDGKRVSGVIDWGNSSYGDFMHDVAWLDFWDPDVDYGKAFREHYRRTDRRVPHFEERLQLHKLAAASGSLGFYVSSKQETVYKKDLAWFKTMDLGL